MNDQTKNRIIEQYRLQRQDQRRQLRRIEQTMWWLRVLAVVIGVEPEVSRYRAEVPLEEDLQAVLYDLCDELGLEEALVLGLIQTESGFVTDAVNPVSGCYGLCQLNPLYFPAGLTPEENLRAGLTYLAEQMERYNGDVAAALTAYNAGRDTGDRSYAGRVLENRKGWEVCGRS